VRAIRGRYLRRRSVATYLHLVTEDNTDRVKHLLISNLRVVRAMRSVLCGVLCQWIMVRSAPASLTRAGSLQSRFERPCS
jgi:hypothetical protein